jgi:hypothetical protein
VRGLTQNPTGKEPDHDLLVSDHERMSRVRSTGVAHDIVCVLRVDVDDLAFAFVTPLGADHHYT